MKTHLITFLSVLAGLTVVTAHAQPRGPQTPSFEGAMGKLFGENSAFSASMEFHTTGAAGEVLTMTAKMSHTEGKAHIEMDMSAAQGGQIPPQAAARMKQMGMSKMTIITRRDKGMSYILYPDMKAYTVMATQEKSAPMSDYKSNVSKLGDETIDSHACVKNKVVVTDPDGATHESTVWNAADLKQFPVKIQTTEKGRTVVILFKDVKLEKPDDAQFDPPSDFKKYDDMMSLMMSRAKGGPPQ